jgi:NifU-like protein involved in Fe-S cluster formation
MKNPLIKDHFLNPRHMGIIESPTHQAILKSETCSDVVKLMLVVNENGIISDIRAQVYGCGYAIAGTSIFNDIAIGKNISQIQSLALETIKNLLPFTPDTNINCIQLAIKVFNKIFGFKN